MRLELVLTGAELLDGRWSDTHTRLLAGALRPLGLSIARTTTVGDGEDEIADALRAALERAAVVIVTGGLGPTADDRTRDAAARVFGLPLIEDEPTVTWLRELFARFGREMKDNNRRQAHFPQGATIIPNNAGTAPGFALQRGERLAVFAPGPTLELQLMAKEQIAPLLRARLQLSTAIASVSLRTFGFTESGLDQRLSPLDLGDVELAFTVQLPEIYVTLTASADAAAAAQAKLAAARAQVEPILGEALISDDGRTIEEVVAALMTERRLTLALAESCTGGLIAARCTNIPGSSDWFKEGTVVYSNEAKTRLLGVPAELLAAHGAVSREVAEAMAVGARAKAGVDLALAVTGIAGPGGGSAEKPVGLVHMALAHADGVQHWQGVKHWQDRAYGDRVRVRAWATEQALDRIRRHLRT